MDVKRPCLIDLLDLGRLNLIIELSVANSRELELDSRESGIISNRRALLLN